MQAGLRRSVDQGLVLDTNGAVAIDEELLLDQDVGQLGIELLLPHLIERAS